MSQLLTHCGSQRCSLEQLLTIPEPQQTNTYQPLNHYDFACNVQQVASDLLSGYRFDRQQYALSSDGQKMFGVITYRKTSSKDQDIKLAIGLRNSYDKSMSAGLAVGATVLVCDNLLFRADIVVMRKHTGTDMHEDLHDQIVTAIYKSQHQFTRLSEDVTQMKQVPMATQDKFKYLGLLTGEGILSPTQSSRAYREVWRPSHEEFQSENLWSGYNAATEALKSSAPQDIVKRHTQLHELTKQLYLN